jgi:hypothetical protein
MSAQLMVLVRELKALNARKKAGETLTPEQENRRKELKTFLKSQLESAGGGLDDGPATTAPASEAPRPVSAAPASPPPRPMTAPSTAPLTVPSTAPPPRPASAAPPQRPAPVRVDAPVVAPGGGAVPAAAPQTAAPRPFTPRKDAFAISGADSFIDAAMSSEAVARVDPWANRKAQASQTELADAEARADAALRATKKRERAVKPEEVEAQLREVQGGYTPPEQDHLVLEQYYGDYFGDGLVVAPIVETAELRPIDPREIELRRALDVTQGPGAATSSMALPPGLAFLDDFLALYAKKVLPPPLVDVDTEPDDPSLLVGKRKVTVHMLNGEKKMGTVRALRRGELGFRLDTPSSSEEIAVSQIKALFVHLQPNATPKTSPGRPVTVMFRDQRAVQGDTDDYSPDATIFTLVPPAGRGQFEKILINAGAVASVT